MVEHILFDQEVSSELTHDIVTYSKNLSPFPIRNRFAPLSLPDLKAELNDDSNSSRENIIERPTSVPEANGFRPVSASGLNVRLSKQQIDKDHKPKDQIERFLDSRKLHSHHGCT